MDWLKSFLYEVPSSGHLFVFCNRRLINVFYWDCLHVGDCPRAGTQATVR